MKTIAENANDFASIRTMDRGNCIYVDKTDFFHRLVTAPGKNLFFIARPRRFGKSLMITTFKYIFEGRRELFKGLKIDKTDYDWKVHPVIHLELKRDGTADEALAQIREKGYEKPYLADGRPVYLIGLAFDSQTRQLVDAAWESSTSW